MTPLPVTATFGDPVAGVAASDFWVEGGHATDVSKLADNVYGAMLNLGPLATVRVGMQER